MIDAWGEEIYLRGHRKSRRKTALTTAMKARSPSLQRTRPRSGRQFLVQPPGSAHYVIVSHGANNSGATSTEAGGAMPCAAGNLEEENCDGDDMFRSSLLQGTADNASLYDDLISIRAMTAFGNQIPEGAVMAFNLNACPLGWVDFAAAEGRFILGVSGTLDLGSAGGLESVTLTPEQTGLPGDPDAHQSGGNSGRRDLRGIPPA